MLSARATRVMRRAVPSLVRAAAAPAISRSMSSVSIGAMGASRRRHAVPATFTSVGWLRTRGRWSSSVSGGAAAAAGGSASTPAPLHMSHSDLLSAPPVVQPPTAIDLSAPASVTSTGAGAPTVLDPTTLQSLEKLYPPPGDHWWNTTAVQDFLAFVHDTSGLPWWATIAAVTVAVRVAMFPVTLISLRNGPRMAAATPEIKLLNEEQKRLNSLTVSQAEKKEISQKHLLATRAIFAKYGAAPSKSLYGLAFAPVFMTGFFALQSMAERYDITRGGFSWITDLSAADPLLVMPLVSAASMLGMIWMGVDPNTGDKQLNAGTFNPKTMRIVFSGFAVLSLIFTYKMPAIIFVYWTTANMFSLTQAALLRFTPMKQWLGVGTTESVRASVQAAWKAAGKSPITLSGQDVTLLDQANRARRARRATESAAAATLTASTPESGAPVPSYSSSSAAPAAATPTDTAPGPAPAIKSTPYLSSNRPKRK